MNKNVLHILSQRPFLTGSGVTLNALVSHASRAGWDQNVIIGIPADSPSPALDTVDSGRIHPLVFGRGELDFAVPGMSDVMPYPSTRFSEMDATQIKTYLNAWTKHLSTVISTCKPDILHTHHVWLLSALMKDIAPDLPVVTQCHATGLRQMKLCPHLAGKVRKACAGNDRFLALHSLQAEELSETLNIPEERIRIVGAGYNDQLFHNRGEAVRNDRAILYVGKYSSAKGLPWLLEAVERLAKRIPDLRLHVAGSGSGREAETLERRMERMEPTVVLHGQIDQSKLAELMRCCAVCTLPSFYEGLPLVLVEALACGCRLVSTSLPGVIDQLLPHIGPVIELVPLPAHSKLDHPDPENPAAFVDDLETAIETALNAPPPDRNVYTPDGLLAPFTWAAVFKRVEKVWKELL